MRMVSKKQEICFSRESGNLKRCPFARGVLLWVIFCLFLPFSAKAEVPEFFAGLVDVPVMPGLTQEPEQAVVFDTPGGRVVEAQAYAAEGVTKSEILGFYTRSLPQLGWQERPAGRFVRDGERLDIQAFQAGGLWAVRLTLAPQ